MANASVRKVRHQRKREDLASLRVYLSPRDKKLIEKAANISGWSLSAFCAPILVKAAKDLIASHSPSQ